MRCINPHISQGQVFRAIVLGVAIMGLMLPQLFTLPVLAATTAPPVTLKGSVAIVGRVQLVPDSQKVSLHMRDADIRDVLHMLAMQGGLNMIVDQNVKGTVTVDLENLSVNKAFEYLFAIGDLSYSQDGQSVIIATKTDATAKNLNAHMFKTIPVKYKAAQTVADQLNATLFKVPRAGGSASAIASSDADTNSIIVVGTATDLNMVQQALNTLDTPRNRKVYTLKYNTPDRVASMLAANFFGSAAGGGGATTSAPFTTGGVTFIPEPLNGTLTVLASAEQMGLIEGAISKMDVRPPQVSIELSLVELTKSDFKSISPNLGTLNAGQVNFSLSPIQASRFFWNPSKARSVNPSGYTQDTQISNNAVNGALTSVFGSRRNVTGVAPLSGASIDNTVTKTKSRVLANPNIIALNGTASNINITENKAYFPATVTTTNGLQTVTYNPVTVTVGIQMTVTPQISNDGSVVLNLQTTVTQPGALARSPDGLTTFLETSARNISLAAVRVEDNHTLVLGGLIRDAQGLSTSEIPFLANLPILGAMFRAMPSNSKDHTELVLMVTPHIIREDATPFLPNGQPLTKPVATPENLSNLPPLQ
jgi:type II secretory pathway component GspD/PulD (secretin)